MRKILLITIGLFSGLCPSLAQEQPAAAAVQPEVEKFEHEIVALEKKINSGVYPAGGIAFVGSSTMRLWKLNKFFPEWKLANLGFGGANIPDTLQYFDRLLTKLKPKQVFFYCGGNDLAQKRTPEQVAADFSTWVEKMQKLVPDCDITFLAIRPSQSRQNIFQLEKKANGLVKSFCETKKLHFVDLEDTVRAADGSLLNDLFQPDKLHLNDAGYKIWTARVLPLLNAKLPH